jgi:patatin-like phospholipase/acyl hydrolase
MSAAALQIRLIKAYEQACPGFLRSVDCFVGASDGGYTALYLALHVTDDDEANLAMLDDAIAFSNALVPLFHLTFTGAIKFASGWWPMLDVDQFKAVFRRFLGDARIRDLRRKAVICSYGAFLWDPVVYSNFAQKSRPSLNYRGNDDTSLVDVALATSALPLVLPLHGKGVDRVVDGGWLSNNPSMFGVTETCAAEAVARGCTPLEVMSEVRVLSLGATDSYEEHTKVVDRSTGPLKFLWERNAWGWVQWVLARPMLLMEMWIQGAIDLSDRQMSAVFPSTRYRRIRPPMSEVGDVWKLMLAKSGTLIAEFDDEAARLVASPAWFEPNVTWIRRHFVGDEG